MINNSLNYNSVYRPIIKLNEFHLRIIINFLEKGTFNFELKLYNNNSKPRTQNTFRLHRNMRIIPNLTVNFLLSFGPCPLEMELKIFAYIIFTAHKIYTDLKTVAISIIPDN